MEKKSFGKQERIRKRREYLTIYEQGERSYSKHFTIVIRPNNTGFRRLGITVSKKAGNSVKRNRIKRLLREFFRLNKSRFASSQDILVIAKKNAGILRYHDVYHELEGILIKNKDI